MMSKEIWMSIPYIADNYQVSNLGRVRNIKPPNQKTPRILNGHSKSTSGKPRNYCRLLTTKGEWKTFKLLTDDERKDNVYVQNGKYHRNGFCTFQRFPTFKKEVGVHNDGEHQ